MLRDQTPKVGPSSELPHTVDDAYKGLDWDSFNDMTLSDSDSGNESAFEAAAEECLRGVPVLGPPEADLNSDGSGCRQKQRATYVVFNGREMGVFQTWSATSFQVHGFQSSSHQGYDSIAEAEAAWEHACASGVIGNPSGGTKKTAMMSPQKPQMLDTEASLLPCLTFIKKNLALHLPTMSATMPLLSNLFPSNLPPINPRAVVSSPTWLPSYPKLPSSCLSSESSLDFSSMTVQEPPSPQQSAFAPVPRKLRPPTPVPLPAYSFQAMPTSPLGDEQAWWVVISGEFPGASLGRKAAKKAAGRLGPVVVRKVSSRAQAFHLFRMSVMDASVTQYHAPAV